MKCMTMNSPFKIKKAMTLNQMTSKIVNQLMIILYIRDTIQITNHSDKIIIKIQAMKTHREVISNMKWKILI